MPDSLSKASSIQRKIRRLIIVSTGSAVIFAGIMLVSIETANSRSTIIEELTTVADMLGESSSAAIEFEDAHAATAVLRSLHFSPRIVAAAIRLPDERQLASYLRSDVHALPDWSEISDGSLVQRGRVVLARPIFLNERRVGTIIIESDLHSLYGRIERYAGIIVIVLLASFILALRLSRKWRKAIAEPILNLAAISGEVARHRNYSTRVQNTSDDEIGLLIEQFNQMLSEIERRDVALEEAKRHAEEQAQKLARSNQELEQFAYIASHDLKEPLRMVGSYTQLLAKRYVGRLDKDADEFIGFAIEGVKRMQRLIDDLLAYSRVGAREPAYQTVDCNKIMREVTRALTPAIAEANANLIVDSLPLVKGDELQLTQVFQNIISNAIKFRAEQPPKIQIHAREQPDHQTYLFSITDNGVGFDSKHVEKVFVMFKRLHSHQKYSGTGIGLAICKKIIERHGGQIWVESSPGVGSTFFFTLRKADQPVAQMPQTDKERRASPTMLHWRSN